jgi:integrase
MVLLFLQNHAGCTLAKFRRKTLRFVAHEFFLPYGSFCLHKTRGNSLPAWRNRLLTEITPDDLRAHCAKIVDRGAPATAIHVRDILKQIYGFAILHGEKVANPADDVGPASIATFAPKDRSLSPTEIRIMLRQLENVATLPTIRLGMKLYLLTMVRKSELQDAVWDEVDFENAVWTIPKERMKRSKAHNVYLSRQDAVGACFPRAHCGASATRGSSAGGFILVYGRTGRRRARYRNRADGSRHDRPGSSGGPTLHLRARQDPRGRSA